MVYEKRSGICIILGLVIKVIMGVIVLFDMVMFAYALLEYYYDLPFKEKAIVSTVRLPPEAVPVNRSVILIHGFVGSPLDFSSLPHLLAQQGFNVVVPVMPSQNHTAFAYGRGSCSPEFYLSYMRKIIDEETRRYGVKPYLVGFSMGGTLAGILAAEGGVDKVVLMAPFFGLAVYNRLVHGMLTVMKWICPLVPKVKRGMIDDPSGYASYRPGSYIISLAAFLNLQNLVATAREKAGEIRVPALVIASPGDVVASYDRIMEMINTGPETMKLLTVQKSNHILLFDYERDTVQGAVLSFLEP
ncbi:MAG: alpha/beta fold hydrolase [Pseudomonadota bacterium]